MTSVGGTTTVTEAASAARASSDEGALIWLFPRPAPPVDLRPGSRRELAIGRDESSAVCLSGNDVSRRHAILRIDPQAGIRIADLGSRNGVRVNGRPVAEAAIGVGDVVRIGGWVGLIAPKSGAFLEIAPGLWGGAALEEALAPLRQAAASDLPIVLEGETGTGKELVARALHRWSGRPGPLVAVNCAALPEGLAEGELFGYRRGAFTGADRPSAGFFRGADGGTLLLDEVSDLPLPVQGKLLRVLEEREVQPLGEIRPVPIDVRVVVAGQQPLIEAVRAGRFRADLLARLDGLSVRLPPLRARREDVMPLFSHLLEEIGQGRAPSMESDFAERLCMHDWPFNVRELVLLTKRLLTLHGSDVTLRAQHLPDRIAGGPSASPAAPSPGTAGVVTRAPAAAADPVELPALVVALRASGGNVARAAAMLGISRQRAYRLMEGQAVDLEALRNPEEKRE
jgi:transcriptional regulator with AAA-type ATPase domain